MRDDHSPCLYYYAQVLSWGLSYHFFFTSEISSPPAFCTMRSSLLQSFQSSREALPMSQPTGTGGGEFGLRKRLSSLSLRMKRRSQQPMLSFSTTSWAFRRSKSLSCLSAEHAGNSIRKWWGWGLGWIMSKKPTFAQDLEMNEEEKAVLGCSSKGSWSHVFYKVRSELRRFVSSDNNVGLPQTFRYDSFNYSNSKARRT